MALTLTYTDSYLTKFITDPIEARALADIVDIGDFTIYWRDKLAVIRGYIIVCIESGATAEDVFSQKLKYYRKEFDMMLAGARASGTTDGVPVASLTMGIERG